MKKIFKLLLFAGVFSSIVGGTIPLAKKKPIIISDFDKVWINATGLIPALARLEPIESLLKSKPANKKNTCEKEQQKLHTFTLKLLDYGRCHPKLVPYIPDLIEHFGKSRRINEPINHLYCYLKNEGYSIVIATNKDRLLYDLAIETLGNEIPDMVDKIFVAEPKNDKTALVRLQTFADTSTTSKRYQDMIYRAINTQPTSKIFHVPSKKPFKEYFTYVIKHLGNNNDMIFIDDNKKNIDAFNALQKDCPYLRRGILYNQNDPDPFIEELIQLNLIPNKNK